MLGERGPHFCHTSGPRFFLSARQRSTEGRPGIADIPKYTQSCNHGASTKPQIYHAIVFMQMYINAKGQYRRPSVDEQDKGCVGLQVGTPGHGVAYESACINQNEHGCDVEGFTWSCRKIFSWSTLPYQTRLGRSARTLRGQLHGT